ncbi:MULTISPECIES: ABC transporter ATP-binding protein [Clostridium]|uniref:ABC transporter ATP-binding protein n=2 Tax=Clostridium TaxID=1485 RepID=A0A7U4JPB3_CLOSG|nr:MULTISPECIES: ABC transporter ATP-binding protein [Clostridium]AJD30767.1 ABC transporter family protein [Clostridium botulinum Prevot_594]AVP62228.1 ABC transporter ATP-binding protein [Clostridium botulinum]AKC62798.1 lipid A export ATP-binding/permease protein MsbA [Clostridium sporogenes]AKJ90050.1 multidrug ABC transporter ATP-binding protein [Clostridium sporogenes]AVP65234.1 ABC transporter ATP-binding protein [Clostridium botulinum]
MIEIFRKIWKFAGKEQKNIRNSIILGFINAIFHMLQIGAIFLTIQALVKKEAEVKTIWYILALMLISIIGKIVTNYFSQLQQTHAGYFMAANKRVFIGNKMKVIPMGFFNQSSLGNITGICTTVLGDVETTAPMVMVLTLGGFITTIVFTIYMLFFDWRIGLITAIGVFLFCFITSSMEKKSRSTAPKRQKAQAELVESILETIQGMGIVKSFNLTKIDNKKVDLAIENSRDTNLAMEQLITPYTIMQQVILRVFSIIIIAASLLFYFKGTMELTYSLMFIVISFIIFEQIESVGHGVAILRICGSSIEQANQMDDTPVMDEKGHEEKPKNHDIILEHVDFSYEKRQILKDINIHMKDKTMTAIIGPSGSGKTTICNLIARFWDVDRGRITIGGTDIRNYTLESLMNQISMVFQNVYLFHDTIENNIRFGNPNATRQEVIEAAKKASCHDFIMSLPNNYDTIIGEKGFSLSGGEKQRISIARAILKDAPIIIFDEATANVDPENEAHLQKAFEELTKNKTIIMIAHRLKTVRHADQILVVDDGKIVQQGRHEELILKEGIYKKFVSERKEAASWSLSKR